MARPDTDRTDPAVRATERVRDLERRERVTRTAVGVVLGAGALAAPFVAAGLVADDGAIVGAVAGSVLLGGSAAAVWPWAWTEDERRHHDLGATWAEARSDRDETVPWDRFAAWAKADGERVALLLLRWAGSTDDPSPLSAGVVRCIDADDVADAATAMEALRERAAEQERRARVQYLEGLSIAERRAHEDALRAVEAATEEHQRRAEAEMRRELAAREAAERRAQAAAVARALRRR